MKKTASIVLLSLMLSFQVFQLCDETHDAFAVLAKLIQTISHKSSGYAAPQPFDDPDADLPLVVGQTLSHGKIASHSILLAVPRTRFPQVVTSAFTSEILMQDRSPPWIYLTSTAPPRISLLLACSSVRILAPPLS